MNLSSNEKLEAIKALINGEWDNPSLKKVGPLTADTDENILYIIDTPKNKQTAIGTTSCPTPGPWWLSVDMFHNKDEEDEFYWKRVYSGGTYEDGENVDVAPARAYGSTKAEAEANALLIAEAGTVLSETGKTPAQLAAENKIMLEALEYTDKQIDKVFGCKLSADVDGLMRGISDALEEALESVLSVPPRKGGE